MTTQGSICFRRQLSLLAQGDGVLGMTGPKNPKDMTDAERMALPGRVEYQEACAVPKKVKCQGLAPGNLAYFVGSDGLVYSPVEHDGVWYKL